MCMQYQGNYSLDSRGVHSKSKVFSSLPFHPTSETCYQWHLPFPPKIKKAFYILNNINLYSYQIYPMFVYNAFSSLDVISISVSCLVLWNIFIFYRTSLLLWASLPFLKVCVKLEEQLQQMDMLVFDGSLFSLPMVFLGFKSWSKKVITHGLQLIWELPLFSLPHKASGSWVQSLK